MEEPKEWKVESTTVIDCLTFWMDDVHGFVWNRFKRHSCRTLPKTAARNAVLSRFLQVLLDELQREQDDFLKNLGH